MHERDKSGNQPATGVSLPRSQPPATPPNFISRKQLFPLFETEVPGATLVVAPTGYGKTALVAEWAQANQRPTIWYTVDSKDSFSDFKTHLENSIESFIPNLNSLKTHLRNTYRKLDADGRHSAVEKAKKLLLI